jgi:hypothetical protein
VGILCLFDIQCVFFVTLFSAAQNLIGVWGRADPSLVAAACPSVPTPQPHPSIPHPSLTHHLLQPPVPAARMCHPLRAERPRRPRRRQRRDAAGAACLLLLAAGGAGGGRLGGARRRRPSAARVGSKTWAHACQHTGTGAAGAAGPSRLLAHRHGPATHRCCCPLPLLLFTCAAAHRPPLLLRHPPRRVLRRVRVDCWAGRLRYQRWDREGYCMSIEDPFDRWAVPRGHPTRAGCCGAVPGVPALPVAPAAPIWGRASARQATCDFDWFPVTVFQGSHPPTPPAAPTTAPAPCVKRTRRSRSRMLRGAAATPCWRWTARPRLSERCRRCADPARCIRRRCSACCRAAVRRTRWR